MKRNKLGIFLLTWIIFFSQRLSVDASHFRGSVVMVRPSKNGSETEISYYLSWRRGHLEGRACNEETKESGDLIGGHRDNLVCFDGCGRTNFFIADLKYRCTAFSDEEDWSFGERITSFQFPGNTSSISVGFQNDAWVSPINGRYRLQTVFSTVPRNDTGKLNSSPRVITSPVIKLQGKCNHTVVLPVSDPDGDVIRCRWAQGSDECGNACNNLEAETTLDSETCTINYQAPEVSRNVFKAVAITIEDYMHGKTEPLSSIGLQFLFLVTRADDSSGGCQTKPKFVPPTYKNGICLAIPPGNLPFSSEVAAEASEGSIVEISYVGPSGMNKSQLIQRQDSNVFALTLSWDVSSEQLEKEQSLCYLAVDSTGRQTDQNCINLLPGIYPPQIVAGTNIPHEVVLDPATTTWAVTFNEPIRRPNQASFIIFYEYKTDKKIYKIDTSSSGEVTIQNSTLSINPSFVFEEKLKFYIVFERAALVSYKGCGPGNDPIVSKDFWTFESLDKTAPGLTFVNSPQQSNTNVSISWELNELNVSVSVEGKSVVNNTPIYGTLKKEVVRFWVSEVVAFSSEYSTNRWSSKQVLGEPNVYPSYGDNSNAWSPTPNPASPVQHIEVRFQNKLFVEEIGIYETFNSGGVVQVSVLDDSKQWVVLWSKTEPSLIEQSRIYRPPITTTEFPIDTLRLDLNVSLASNSEVQIDAIEVTGLTDWENTWEAYGLVEGEFAVDVTATDATGNSATYTHTFAVDTTPPSIKIWTEHEYWVSQSIPNFLSQCEETYSCSYECYLENITSSEAYPLDCRLSGSYIVSNMSDTVDGSIYKLYVRATDEVGNVGQWYTHDFRPDLNPPVITGPESLQANCGDSLQVKDFGGQVTSVDEHDPNPSLHESLQEDEDCYAVRRWFSIDHVLQLSNFYQRINISYIHEISILRDVRIECNTATVRLNETHTPLNPHPDCLNKLQIVDRNDNQEYACPGVHNISITIRDNCTGEEKTMYQRVELYATCPFDACGQNLTEPWGACRAGQCSCSQNRYGQSCQFEKFPPVIAPVPDTFIDDTTIEYNQNMTLTQGSGVIYWKLVQGPESMEVDNTLIGHVLWEKVKCGTHNITVEARNDLGSSTGAWQLVVSNSYQAQLHPLLNSVLASPGPVTLSGNVSMLDGSAVATSREVIIEVTGTIKRKVSIFTDTQGQFAWTFSAPVTEKGIFVASVRHPCQATGQSQVSWQVLSMKVSYKTVRISGESFVETQATFQAQQVVTNDGPANLHNLTLSIPNLNIYPDIESLEVTPDSSTNELESGESLTYAIALTIRRPTRSYLSIGLTTSEGTYLIFDISVNILPVTPELEITPQSLNLNALRGSIRTVSITVRNTGATDATNVHAIFPDLGTIGLSVTSFVVEGYESTSPLLLPSNSSGILIFSLNIPDDQPFGTGSGSMVISSNEVSVNVPISLSITSDVNVMLIIIVEDEYTYFANGQPLVTNAQVDIRNNFGFRETLNTTLGNGTVSVSLPEGAYQLHVSAPNHGAVQENRIVSSKQQVARIFLQRQMVTYSWRVTPVLFQDTYIITLEADFETYVPAPVVTIEPNFIEVEEFELGLQDSITFNITNHGLIRADDVAIFLPQDHPTLVFSTELETIGNLPARTSVLVPYSVRRRDRRKRSSGCGSYAGRFVYYYVCGTLRSAGSGIAIRSRRARGSCGSSVGGGGGGGGGGFGWGGATGGGGCDPCILSVFNDCGINFIPGVGSCAAAGVGTGLAIANGGTGGGMGSVMYGASLIGCGLSLIPHPAAQAGALALGVLGCLYSATTCAQTLGNQSRRRKRGVKDVIYQYGEASEPFLLSLEIGIEILGDAKWFNLKEAAIWYRQYIDPAFNDISEDGILLSDSEVQTIRNAPRPDGVSSSDVRQLVERMQNTMRNWNNGKLERDNTDENMASNSYVSSREIEIEILNQKFVSQGFNSYVDALEYYVSELEKVENYEEPEGVCAVVRVRIEQELTLTREAFEASLEINNQESKAISEISLVITVTDSQTGVVATQLFSFSNGSFTGSLAAVDGTGTLGANQKGEVTYLIVPLSEAAPTEDKEYDIAGTLKYTNGEDEVTIPLFPTTVTVKPDPSLCVHYFWEKDVWSDDPFTDTIEPSIPITLAVVVQNQGYGMANDLKITSSQPEIIENEKGLLVSFEIIGSTVNGNPRTNSLTVDFGDVDHDETVMATWLLTSTLKGEFKNFSATFENINPLGDPRLSVLDCLEIHQMLKPVMMYIGEENDTLIDFLTNDRIDIYDNPENVYSSKNLKNYPVQTFNAYELIPNSVGKEFSFQLSISVNDSGWTFSRYEDSTDLIETDEYTPVKSVYEITANERKQVPKSNAWVTSVKRGSRKVFFANIFFFAETVGNYTFEVVFQSDEEISISSSALPDSISPTVGITSSSIEILPSQSVSSYSVVGSQTMTTSLPPNTESEMVQTSTADISSPITQSTLDIQPTKTVSVTVSSTTEPCVTEIPQLPSNISVEYEYEPQNRNLIFNCSHTLPIQKSVVVTQTFKINNESVLETTSILEALESKIITRHLFDSSIKCCISVKFERACDDAVSQEKCSDDFIVDVQLPTQPIVVDEKEGTAVVEVLPNISPNLLCSPQTSENVELYLRAKLDRARDELWCAASAIPQAVMSASTVGGTCGSDITNYTRWVPGNPMSFSVRASTDGILDGDLERNLSVSLIKVAGGSELCAIELGSVTLSIKEGTPDALCAVFGTGFAFTFSGLPFSISNTGEFVLFQNSDADTECHVQYVLCSLSNPESVCVCSLTCRVGDDVIKISKCPTASLSFLPLSAIPVRLWSYLNNDAPQKTFVHSSIFGDKTNIILPTGATVTVFTNMGVGLDVYVKPGASDVSKASGLCNELGSTSEPLLIHSDGIISEHSLFPTDFVDSWLVTNSFHIGTQPSVNAPVTDVWCSCMQDQNSQCTEGGYIQLCQEFGMVDLRIFEAPFAFPSWYATNRRVRRQVSENEALTGAYESVDPKYTATPSNTTTNVSWPTLGGITLESAKNICTEAITGDSDLEECLNLGNVNATARIDLCVAGVGRADDRNVTADHFKFMRASCAVNLNRVANFAPDSQTAAANNQNSDLTNNLCQTSCSSQGTCVSGVCKCNMGFTGVDCRERVQNAPSVLFIQENPCNIQSSPCTDVLVQGEQFADIQDVTCHLQPVEISGHTVASVNPIVTVKAKYITNHLVQCTLPQSKSFMVRVSNDGKIQSSSAVLFVAFDGSCSNCTILSTTNASCSTPDNVCHIDSRCYDNNTFNEKDSCLYCNPSQLQNSWSVLNSSDCEVEDDEGGLGTPAIVAIAVATVVVLLLFVLVVSFCCGKSDRSKNESVQPTLDASSTAQRSNAYSNRSGQRHRMPRKELETDDGSNTQKKEV